MRFMVLVIVTAILVGCPEATEKRPVSIIGDWVRVTYPDLHDTLRRFELKEGGVLILKVTYQGAIRLVEGTWKRSGDRFELSFMTDRQEHILIEARITELTESLLCWTSADAPSDAQSLCYRRVDIVRDKLTVPRLLLQ